MKTGAAGQHAPCLGRSTSTVSPTGGSLPFASGVTRRERGRPKGDVLFGEILAAEEPDPDARAGRGMDLPALHGVEDASRLFSSAQTAARNEATCSQPISFWSPNWATTYIGRSGPGSVPECFPKKLSSCAVASKRAARTRRNPYPAGSACRVNTLRPCCGPTAMRYVIEELRSWPPSRETHAAGHFVAAGCLSEERYFTCFKRIFCTHYFEITLLY